MKKLNFYTVAYSIFAFALFAGFADAQSVLPTPPPPSAPRPVKIPNIQETTLPNGLRVAVIERKNVPLVTATLLVKSGGSFEGEKAGLADLTASLLLKGTKTRSATQIAEEIEFLGGTINSSANWNASSVSINVTSDKLDKAMNVMADAILNPAFAPSEIDLLKTQTIDQLNVALKQPSTLANFVAARYTFGEHAVAGTPESLMKLTRDDIVRFYGKAYSPENSVLIFVGDVSQAKGNELAAKLFAAWKPTEKDYAFGEKMMPSKPSSSNLINRILVIDLPNSGQAAVVYANRLDNCRGGEDYYPATVANAVLGGGYSARLNQEIRIKRGLSYGAGSGFAWRLCRANFSTRGQTKNISAPEVAEFTVTEINKLANGGVMAEELNPRKLSLTGDFGRTLSTNSALAQKLVELYSFGLKPAYLNSYITDVDRITDADIKNYLSKQLKGGDLIIVGDYKIFADDLKKRFPNQKIEVIQASRLDLNRNDLKKPPVVKVMTKSKGKRN